MMNTTGIAHILQDARADGAPWREIKIELADLVEDLKREEANQELRRKEAAAKYPLGPKKSIRLVLSAGKRIYRSRRVCGNRVFLEGFEDFCLVVHPHFWRGEVDDSFFELSEAISGQKLPGGGGKTPHLAVANFMKIAAKIGITADKMREKIAMALAAEKSSEN
jgi:hypothetical protein